MGLEGFDAMRTDNSAYDGLSVADGKTGFSPIAELKRAAIDAYVWQVLKDHVDKSTYTRDGSGYSFKRKLAPPRTSPFGPDPDLSKMPHTYKLTPPTFDGNNLQGGGDLTKTQDKGVRYADDNSDDKFINQHNFADGFQQVNNRIDRALEPWLSLPDPNPIVDELCGSGGNFKNAYDLLAVAGGDTGVTGSSDLAFYLRTLIVDHDDAMEGASWYAFRTKYAHAMPGAVNGNFQLLCAGGSALAGEQQVFAKARQGVVNIVNSATDVFSKAATPSTAKAGLKVSTTAAIGAAVVAAVATVATGVGPAGVALAVGGAGLQIVEKVADDREEVSKANGNGNYDGAMTAFEGCLTDLNEEIKKSEKELKAKLDYNVANVTGRNGGTGKGGPTEEERLKAEKPYGVNFAAIDPENGGTLSIKKDQSGNGTEVREGVIGNDLPGIERNLLDAVESVKQHGKLCGGLIKKDSRIGIGADGANDNNLMVFLSKFVNELATETNLAKRNLELTVECLETQDAASSAEIKKVIADINEREKRSVLPE